jgi:hypothetical protein
LSRQSPAWSLSASSAQTALMLAITTNDDAFLLSDELIFT